MYIYNICILFTRTHIYVSSGIRKLTTDCTIKMLNGAFIDTLYATFLLIPHGQNGGKITYNTIRGVK